MTFNTFNLDLPQSTLEIDDRGELLKELKTSNVIAIDGFPGVGKSTISKYVADNIDAVVIELDHFRTNRTGSFLLTIPDENLIADVINVVKSHSRKIIIDGVLVLDLLKNKKIQYDKYIWIAERDNDNNKYQFIFQSYRGISVENCPKLEQELLKKFIELDPLKYASIFYRQDTQ